jgi:glycosyltransferase involved in cell wall biosynthesis
MKIVIDGRWLGRTGIGRYVEELLRELQELDHTNEYVVLVTSEGAKVWRPAQPNFSVFATSYEVYTWQEQLLLGGQIKRLKPDLVHFTSFNLPVLYAGRFVTTVHDLTLVDFKNVRGQGFKKLLYEVKYRVMRLVLWAAVRRAAAVLVPTQYVRGELERRFGDAVGAKTQVTHEAVRAQFAEPAAVERFGLPKRYLLYVGNYYPYKNVGRLVEAFARTAAYRNGVKLVLNGKPDYFQEQVRAVVRRLDVGQGVVFPGRTSDGELVSLYRGAEAFIIPSLSEGFGLPALEAMAYGTPVLSSNASCLPEIYGEAAEYFDPLDVGDMAAKIDGLLEAPQRLQELRAAGPQQVARYSWRRMAEQTLEMYARITGRQA